MPSTLLEKNNTKTICVFFFEDLYLVDIRGLIGSNFIPPLYSRGARNRVGKKKSEQKKRSTTTTRRRPPILYLVKLFTFLSKFLPFIPSFNLQKLFLMCSTSTIYPKYILRKQILQNSFSEKKKNQKKLFIFFFSIFFSLTKTYSTPFSFYFIVILLSTKKKIEKTLRSTSTF